MALSRRPASLEIPTLAINVAVRANSPAIRNQASVDRSKLSKPTSPLEEPVNSPPEYSSCTMTIGSTREITDA